MLIIASEVANSMLPSVRSTYAIEALGAGTLFAVSKPMDTGLFCRRPASSIAAMGPTMKIIMRAIRVSSFWRPVSSQIVLILAGSLMGKALVLPV